MWEGDAGFGEGNSRLCHSRLKGGPRAQHAHSSTVAGELETLLRVKMGGCVCRWLAAFRCVWSGAPATWARVSVLPRKCSPLPREQRGAFFLGLHGPSVCSTSLCHYVVPSQDYNEGQGLFGLRWNLPRIRERQISTNDSTGHCSCDKCAEVECSHAGGFCTTTHVAQKSDFSSDCRLSAPMAISQSSSQFTSPLLLGHHTRPFQCPLLGAL